MQVSRREVSMRTLVAMLSCLALLALGCPAAGTPTSPAPPPAPVSPAGPAPVASPSPFTPPERVLPERRVEAYVDGVRRIMDIDDARSAGLTVIDLSDDWVPYIFWSRTPGRDDYKANEYLDDYVDLANDRVDVDGVALKKWERNYHEVYGIPPSLAVLRQRFLEDEEKACFRELDLSVFKEGYFGPIKIVDPLGSERELKRYYALRADYQKALRKARVKTLEALLAQPATKRVAEQYQAAEWRQRVLRVMQDRLACEGMFGRKVPQLKPGIITWSVREALREFERKHNIYGWGMVFEKTAEALGRTALENNFESLKRALTERVVSAAQILEDGTAKDASYKSRSGQRLKVRDLVREFRDALLAQMGLTSPERGLAFMREHKDFRNLFVAVKLPEVPEYYSDSMELSVVIDRGDVWYDLPFDEKGKPKSQPRGRLPVFTLYTTYGEQKIPLVRWRTTIGGWQPEMRHDEEYYKYKVSDVGPRIWRNVIAGPVWVPPKNTPSRDMIKIRPVGGQTQRIVAHQSFGPGYASAYGLVAAFHVTPGGHDNQVRTHGSVNYMSIQGKYSHGCHRLHNYRAVRLFSFVLAHRSFERRGQTRLGYTQRFEHLGEEFELELRTRGYYYELKPPIQVNVLEGNIRGELKEPIEEYVKKPSVVYQDDIATAKQPRKDAGSAPKVGTKQPKSIMSQEQDL